MNIIDCTGLLKNQQEVRVVRWRRLTIMTGHRSRAEKKANEVLSPVFDCAATRSAEALEMLRRTHESSYRTPFAQSLLYREL